MQKQEVGAGWEALIYDVQASTFADLLACIAAGIWLVLVVYYLVVGYPPAAGLILWAMVQGIIAFAYWQHNDHFSMSVYIFVAGLWICNLIAVYIFGVSIFLYLFSLLCVLGSVLTKRRLLVLLNSLTTAFLLIRLPSTDPGHSLLSPILFMWLSLLISLTAHRSLYRALDLAWIHQDYANRQMEEARDHRRELMHVTKALREAKEDLVRANTQLQHARSIAEEARRLKAQFAATVSHELRTPINLIVGFSEVLVNSPQSYGEPLPSAYWTDLNTIYRNGRHLQGLINDVLDVSQIEAGQLTIIPEETDLARIVEEACDLVRDEIRHRGLAFNVIVPKEILRLRIDPLRIRQVILNLLGNAIRFTEQGAISLEVSQVEQQLRIVISDTGIGIPPAELHRVFEEFHQLDGSLARKHGGSGLGLTLSLRFVELHGGRLWATSTGVPGEGSAFTLALPITAKAPWETRGPAYAGLQGAQPRNFVVLDDDPAIAQLFTRYTKTHAVTVASTEAEAIRIIDTIEPSALVMDCRRVAHQIEQHQLRAGRPIPIIECPMPSGKRTMQEYGIADYLIKPVTFEQLSRAVQALNIPIRSILIVDDEKDIVRLFTRLLERMSKTYQIRKAYSGREGLQLMRHQRPDLLILDLLLPEMDGFAVIEQMKAAPELADIPILLASAHGGFDAVQDVTFGKLAVSKRLGFQPVELVECVEALVGTLRPATGPTP
jgi:signal transduction histidine kinase/CheY-like chemotaxis protein